MKNLVFGFYAMGAIIVLKGILILWGFDLPKRNGKIPDNPIEYAYETIIFGAVILVVTYIYSKYNKK